MLLLTFLLAAGFQGEGPIYLSDEIGYLTKAAALAGRSIDYTTDWHAGYAILISPAFRLFSDPLAIWWAITIINAVLFTVSFLLLSLTLRRIFPHTSFTKHLAILAICALYPSWAIMTGYAFSTPAFVFMFVALFSVLSFLNEKGSSLWYQALLGVVAGLLYWIHPMSLAVLGALSVVQVARVVSDKKAKWTQLFVFLATVFLTMITYAFVLNPSLQHAMTLSVSTGPGHYARAASWLSGIKSIGFWRDFVLIVMGQTSYMLVVTFGIVSFAGKSAWDVVRKTLKREPLKEAEALTLFSILSVLGIVAMGSILFAAKPPFGAMRADQLIYGRYTEMALLPLLAISLHLVDRYWNRKTLVVSAAHVFLTGVVITLALDKDNIYYNNLINIVAFWPNAIYTSTNHLIWFGLGGFAILMTGLFRRFMLLAVIPLLVISIYHQNTFRAFHLSTTSRTSSLVDIIKDNFDASTTCIGYTKPDTADIGKKERVNLYFYHLNAFSIVQSTEDSWLESPCTIWLTYEDIGNLVLQGKAKVVGREESTGMLMVVKPGVSTESFKVPEYAKLDNFYLAGNLEKTGEDDCTLQGCFDRRADELLDFTSVGSVLDGKIHTVGQSGFLFFGPYEETLEAGSYKVNLYGDLRNLRGAILEVTGNEPAVTALREHLSGTGYSKISVEFLVKEKLNKAEVRLIVSRETDIRVDFYRIENN